MFPRAIEVMSSSQKGSTSTVSSAPNRFFVAVFVDGGGVGFVWDFLIVTLVQSCSYPSLGSISLFLFISFGKSRAVVALFVGRVPFSVRTLSWPLISCALIWGCVL